MDPIPIPSDVESLVRTIFADCNTRVSRKLGRIPNLHETSLDHSFIEHFTHHCRPVKTESDWTVRFDCHFIGGGRHYMRWEVADIGILVVFRRKGRVQQSKVTLLQAKRLYPNETPTVETNPLDRDLGFNYMFMDDRRWSELTEPRTFTFTDSSLYRALEVGDEQYDAIEKYEARHSIPVHYLLYNPPRIPSSVEFPITENPSDRGKCRVGCRVIPSGAMREMVRSRIIERPPSYGDVSTSLSDPFGTADKKGGWRLESYIINELIACNDGLVDTSPKYNLLQHIFSQKSQPIHAAITITFDIP